MDLLHVTGSTPVHVLDVTLLGATGLRLTDVTFLPGNAVGGGFRYGDPAGLAFPDAWQARRSMPGAVLTPLAADSTIVASWSHTPDWQAVIGVLPTSPSGGSARGVRYDYKVGSSSGVLDGYMAFAINLSGTPC